MNYNWIQNARDKMYPKYTTTLEARRKWFAFQPILSAEIRNQNHRSNSLMHYHMQGWIIAIGLYIPFTRLHNHLTGFITAQEHSLFRLSSRLYIPRRQYPSRRIYSNYLYPIVSYCAPRLLSLPAFSSKAGNNVSFTILDGSFNWLSGFWSLSENHPCTLCTYLSLWAYFMRIFWNKSRRKGYIILHLKWYALRRVVSCLLSSIRNTGVPVQSIIWTGDP